MTVSFSTCNGEGEEGAVAVARSEAPPLLPHLLDEALLDHLLELLLAALSLRSLLGCAVGVAPDEVLDHRDLGLLLLVLHHLRDLGGGARRHVRVKVACGRGAVGG